MTPQGSPHTTFQRALKQGSLVIAEMTAREIGWISLKDALELTILVAQQDSPRYPRYSARWLERYLGEERGATLADAAFALGCLAALTGPMPADAIASLRAMAERVAKPRPVPKSIYRVS